MTNEPTIYTRAGGDAAFQRLVDGFYRRVAEEPLLRPLYPDEDLTAANQRLFLFITQYFGGPRRYNEQRGAPMLRMRHAPFAIGQDERNVWTQHMLAALEEAEFPAEVVPAIRDYFERAATFLINRAPPKSISLQG
jgi:hemoglobin